MKVWKCSWRNIFYHTHFLWILHQIIKTKSVKNTYDGVPFSFTLLHILTKKNSKKFYIWYFSEYIFSKHQSVLPLRERLT